MQTVLNMGWDKDRIVLPPALFENAWNLFLPKGALSVLLSVLTYIIHNHSKKEILDLMRREAKALSLIPFRFHSQVEDYREEQIRILLERSGYLYPRSVEDIIQLFIQWGILFDVERNGIYYLDMILVPFPLPENNLCLGEWEQKAMLEYKRKNRCRIMN